MRSRRTVLLIPYLFVPTVIAQSILVESALVLQAPMYKGIWPAWYDGDQFWIQPKPLMHLLGYETLVTDSTELTVRDRHHAITFHYAEHEIRVNNDLRHSAPFSMVGSDGEMLITMEALEHAFGSDLVWDIDALTLQLSSAATLFDPTRLSTPEDPPIIFPRERTWLGGVHIGYTLSHQWRERTGRTFSPAGRIVAHVAGGTVRWDVSRLISQVHYTYAMDHPWMSRIQVGQIGHGWGAQISNRPLATREIHREEVVNGVTIPHAIVRSTVSGAVRQEVQADQEGRYSLQYPVVYGSTETEIVVEPLGASPTELSKTYWRTPSEILPAGLVEYDITVSEHPYGKLSWGLLSQLTVHASASRFPRNATLRALALLRPTMHLDLRADILDRSAQGEVHWWRPWGGLNASAQIYEHRQQASVSMSLNGEKASLHTRVSHLRTDMQPPRTLLHSVVGWQLMSNLGVYTGVHLQSDESILLRPRLNFVLPITRPRLHLRASAVMKDQRIETYGGGLLASSRRWSSGIRVASNQNQLEVRGNFQLSTDWAWFNSRGGWVDGELFHTQTLRGTVMIGEDIRFAALYEQRTQAVIRLFIDTNLNGIFDYGETPSLGHQINMGGHLLLHHSNGDVVAPNLVPYETYPIRILEESIPDPRLHPLTGYTFAFVATPGRTRYLDIALQPLPTVFGQLENWDGSYTVLQAHLTGDGGTHKLDVYQDGVFVAQIPPGDYRLRIVNLLTHEMVKETELTVASGSNSLTIEL